MKTKHLLILPLLLSLASCVRVSKQMSGLRPLENYASQNVQVRDKNALDAKITFANGEILDAKIRGQKNIISGTLTETSITKLFPIFTRDGKMDFIYFQLVKELVVNDFKGLERRFINRGPEYKSLQEVFYDGKIKWYREYYNNIYDGSVQIIDHFINEKGEKVDIGLFDGIKKLKKITTSKPELSNKIDSINKIDRDKIIEILKEYEQ